MMYGINDNSKRLLSSYALFLLIVTVQLFLFRKTSFPMEKAIIMSNRAIPFYLNKINSKPLGREEDKNTLMMASETEASDNKNEKIVKISVLGERHTGTTWIWKHLDKCFDGKVKVNRHLTRYKHWFQYDDGQKHEKTLVISLFRDPYYWTMAMRKIPHHAPMHLYLQWKTFVTKIWTMPRIGKDLSITNTTGRICQEKFYYNEVISCNKYLFPDGYFDHRKKPPFSGHQPLYELRNDGSGEPFNNVLELRSAKIKNFLEIKSFSFVHDVWSLKYEDLLEQGTEKLIKEIEDVTGVKASCKPSPPQKKRRKRRLDPLFISWLNNNLDWDVERSIGYDKMQVQTTISEE